MSYHYQVVPFVASMKAGGNRAQAVAEQLAALINEYTGQGYEYYRLDHCTLIEQPGCLAGLFGAKPSVIGYDVAIFRRPAQ